ncbi:DUF3006 family protein [Caryophanon tenue]|uniref:DUF3006 domain-containing protein n=1 Tax=Caryophanon tenue TaxID=33978 RepID=A0A1C0YIM4_9BACL|nr:DUF3006 family protein [Caryophanon tenue]OCS87032.1 hypothetical protein A6M13_11760 [Caryophanon tenue]
MPLTEYTLDRYEHDYAIFLKRPEECEQLLVHRSEMLGTAQAGDICTVIPQNGKFIVQVLSNKTKQVQHQAEDLLAKLRNKKKRT